MLYNIVLVSAVQQSEPAVHTHLSPLFEFPSHLGHQRALSSFPVWCSRLSLVAVLYTVVYVFLSHLPVHPITPSLLVAISAFSTFVSLFWLWK